MVHVHYDRLSSRLSDVCFSFAWGSQRSQYLGKPAQPHAARSARKTQRELGHICMRVNRTR